MHPIRHLAKQHSRSIKLATVAITFCGLIASLTLLGQALFAEEMLIPYPSYSEQQEGDEVSATESGSDEGSPDTGPVARLRQLISRAAEDDEESLEADIEEARLSLATQVEEAAENVIRERTMAAVESAADGILDGAVSVTESSTDENGDETENASPEQVTEEQVEEIEGAVTSFWSAAWGKLWPFMKSMAAGFWNALTDFIRIEVTPAEVPQEQMPAEETTTENTEQPTETGQDAAD